MRVIELQTENVKRLKAVTIRPAGNMVVLGGRNGQGKTSVLDSLEMLLGGNKAIPPDPVRHGEASARIVVDLGELVVEKHISHKGTTLTVRNADGVKQSSPQTILDKLFSKISFDPAAFARMGPKEQDKLLKDLTGCDLAELDADRAKIYERRTELNRAVKQLEARVAGLPEHKGAPADEVSVAELMAELEVRQAGDSEKRRLLSEVQRADIGIGELKSQLFKTRNEIENLEELLAHARSMLEQDTVALAERENERDRRVAVAKSYTYDDPAEIKAQLATVEATNRQVRENADRAKALESLKQARNSAQQCTDALAGIDALKAERLAAVKFPVPGLGFGELGPTMDGVPLEQASSAQQLRVSVAIGAALNPELRVLLVREGAFLDDESMALLAQFAEEHDVQVWVERVSDRDPGAIIIEDGEVRDAQE